MQEIKNAMMEQQTGSSQISDSLILMKESANNVKSESVKMNEQISAMEQNIGHISDSGKSLTEISNIMSDPIKHIGNRIDEFKV